MRQKTWEDYKAMVPKKGNKLRSSEIRCSHCNSEKFVKDGKRRRKYQGVTQVYKCLNCKRKFSEKLVPHTQYPFWVIEICLSLFVEGNRTEAIVQEIQRTARMVGFTLSISVPTVINIIKTWSKMLSTVEDYFHHTIPTNVWQIDDCFQPRPHRLWWYVTNVLAVEFRYWLSSSVSENRNAEASIQAMKQAVKKAGYYPVSVQCDGLHSHAVGIKRVTPNACINQQTKPKNLAIVNYTERLNKTMRRGQIAKGKCFVTMDLLQAAADLRRIQYNFLEVHDSLNGKTPAEAVGIKLHIKNWKDLITIAHRLHREKNKKF